MIITKDVIVVCMIIRVDTYDAFESQSHTWEAFNFTIDMLWLSGSLDINEIRKQYDPLIQLGMHEGTGECWDCPKLQL